ncbi:hypothetical protein B0H11DRAFT_2199489 [Mycena galericulata]|nr:hypothetical protein B0H11DRAFT_2199489 [Mycena galericulata]
MVDRMIENATQWRLAVDASPTDGFPFIFELEDPTWPSVLLFGPVGSCFGAFMDVEKRDRWPDLKLNMSNQDGTRRFVAVREILQNAAKDLPNLKRHFVEQATREASRQYLDFLLRLEAFLYFLLWNGFPSFIHSNLMKDLHDHHRATFKRPEGSAQASFEGLCAKNLWDLRRKHQPFHPGGKPLTDALLTLLPTNWVDPREKAQSHFLRLSDPSLKDRPVAPISFTQPSVLPREITPKKLKRRWGGEEELNLSDLQQGGEADRLRKSPRPRLRAEPSSSNITIISLPERDVVAIRKTPYTQRTTPAGRTPAPVQRLRKSEREKVRPGARVSTQSIRRPDPALPRPKVFARNVHSAAGAPLILGHSLVMTFEKSERTRFFGPTTLQGDADALLEFFRLHGGSTQLDYVRYLCAVLSFAEHDIPSTQPGAHRQGPQSTSLGLVLERVDNEPRAFGDNTLQADSEGLLAFLNRRPNAVSHQYIGYLRAVLDSVEAALQRG